MDLPDRITTVHTLETPFEQMRGVVGRYPGPTEAYVFDFQSTRQRGVHMVGVPQPLTVAWYHDGEEISNRRLTPWVGVASNTCDMIVEYRPTSLTPSDN